MIVVDLSIFRNFVFYHCRRKETPKTGAKEQKNAIIVIKLFEFYQNKIDKLCFFLAAPNETVFSSSFTNVSVIWFD